SQGGSSQAFTVAADGTIDYDPSLEGVLAGRGTASLAVQGRAIAVDASALTGGASLWIDAVAFAAGAPFTARLLPGRHALWSQGGWSQVFTVAADGTIDYDPSLEGVLTGRGTASLVVRGRAVAVDASALTGGASLWIDSVAFAAGAPFTAR